MCGCLLGPGFQFSCTLLRHGYCFIILKTNIMLKPFWATMPQLADREFQGGETSHGEIGCFGLARAMFPATGLHKTLDFVNPVLDEWLPVLLQPLNPVQ